MENHLKIGFIGAGNIAYALMRGMLAYQISPDQLYISDINHKLLDNRVSTLQVHAETDNRKLCAQCKVIFLAVKPQQMSAVCRELAGECQDDHIFVSVAAGIPTKAISNWLAFSQAIIRLMPNTPALIEYGACGAYANAQVNSQQKSQINTLINPLGLCLWFADESLLDTVTAVSGSGPGYFFLMMEAMIDCAVKLGLEEKAAHQLVTQTALGAAKMAQTQGDCRALRDQVTSPNGTTAAAIAQFKQDDFNNIITRAMTAAYQRARQLSHDSIN